MTTGIRSVVKLFCLIGLYFLIWQHPVKLRMLQDTIKQYKRLLGLYHKFFVVYQNHRSGHFTMAGNPCLLRKGKEQYEKTLNKPQKINLSNRVFPSKALLQVSLFFFPPGDGAGMSNSL